MIEAVGFLDIVAYEWLLRKTRNPYQKVKL